MSSAVMSTNAEARKMDGRHAHLIPQLTRHMKIQPFSVALASEAQRAILFGIAVGRFTLVSARLGLGRVNITTTRLATEV